jgi:hypothetical protein
LLANILFLIATKLLGDDSRQGNMRNWLEAARSCDGGHHLALEARHICMLWNVFWFAANSCAIFCIYMTWRCAEAFIGPATSCFDLFSFFVSNLLILYCMRRFFLRFCYNQWRFIACADLSCYIDIFKMFQHFPQWILKNVATFSIVLRNSE